MPTASRPHWVTIGNVFFLWKALVLLIAYTSPGPGYDTSTALQQHALEQESVSGEHGSLPGHLVRWDALYFTAAARRGYLYEQDWAFGWGFTRVLHIISSAFPQQSPDLVPWIAVVTSHGCHFLSALALHRLYTSISESPNKGSNALIAATLHVVSPAGIFLSSPYGESAFSLLNILGYLLYVHGSRQRRLSNDVSIVMSGLLFGAATTMRSNGLLNGLVFAADTLALGPTGILADFRYAGALLIGGILNAAGSAWPQYQAYLDFCTGNSGDRRPWCDALIPSAYSFVQQRYWNVGFLRYWTVSNLPLFLLALPMLALMLFSALAPIQATFQAWMRSSAGVDDELHGGTSKRFETKMWSRLALPQLLLTVLAFTNFHVQIITRLSSGYVLPTAVLAGMITDDGLGNDLKRYVRPKWIVQWMVMYALIQGGLYAGFLPPA